MAGMLPRPQLAGMVSATMGGVVSGGVMTTALTAMLTVAALVLLAMPSKA